MGIGGHILGPKKLCRLAALTGLPLDRAYIRGRESEGVVWSPDGTGCTHYLINPRTGEHREHTPDFHWATCTNRSLAEPPPKDPPRV